MKIFVSGHEGFIGSHVVKKIKSNFRDKPLTVSRKTLDLCNVEKTKEFLQDSKPEVVVMCAGKTGGVEYNLRNPYSLASKNNLIQHSLFDACAITESVNLIIFIGSSCMYPLSATKSMTEDMLLKSHPEKSSISYAMAKLMGVYYCDAINRQYPQKKAITIIPASVFGEGDDFCESSSHVVGALIKKGVEAKKNNEEYIRIWGDGSAVRQFLYVNNLVDAIIFLIGRCNGSLNEYVYNVAVDSGFSIAELASKILDELKYPVPINCDLSKPTGAKNKLIDSSRLIKMGWKPTHSLEVGLRKTIKWYLQSYM